MRQTLRAGKLTQKAAKHGHAREPSVRWYDARARVALHRVALWLNIPDTKLTTFECLLAQQAQVSAQHSDFQRLTNNSCPQVATVYAACVSS